MVEILHKIGLGKYPFPPIICRLYPFNRITVAVTGDIEFDDIEWGRGLVIGKIS
jgi:hypothetical protein